VPQGAFCVSSVLFPAAILGGGCLSAASKSWWKHTEHLVYYSPIGRRARTSSKCVALTLPRLFGSLGQAGSRNLHRSKRRGPSQHHCRRASPGCPCFHACLHDSPQIFLLLQSALPSGANTSARNGWCSPAHHKPRAPHPWYAVREPYAGTSPCDSDAGWREQRAAGKRLTKGTRQSIAPPIPTMCDASLFTFSVRVKTPRLRRSPSFQPLPHSSGQGSIPQPVGAASTAPPDLFARG